MTQAKGLLYGRIFPERKDDLPHDRTRTCHSRGGLTAAVACGLLAAVALTGCASPTGKANEIGSSFQQAFPEAQFAVRCSDSVGADSPVNYICEVLWSAPDHKLTVRETYEWQKRSSDTTLVPGSATV